MAADLRDLLWHCERRRQTLDTLYVHRTFKVICEGEPVVTSQPGTLLSDEVVHLPRKV